VGQDHRSKFTARVGDRVRVHVTNIATVLLVFAASGE